LLAASVGAGDDCLVSGLRILVVAVTLACIAAGLSACGASKRTTALATGAVPNPIHSCGSLSQGERHGLRVSGETSVGWVVHATSNVACSVARSLVRRFIASSRDRKVTRHVVHVFEGGYSCVGRVVGHSGVLIFCANRTRRVIATPPSTASIFVG
jgi:hypothetical protein